MLVTCRDGRLRDKDRVLAVDGHLLSEKSSMEDAVHWLHDAAGKVTLVVAHKPGSPHPLAYNSLSPASFQHPYGEITVSHHLSCGIVVKA